MYRSRVGTHPQETKHNFLNGFVTSAQLLYWSCNSGLYSCYQRLLRIRDEANAKQNSLADLLANLWVRATIQVCRTHLPNLTHKHAGGLWYSVHRDTVKIMRCDTEHVASHLSVPSVAEQSIFTLAFRHIDQSRMCTAWRLRREFTGRIHYTVMQQKRWYLRKPFCLNDA
jgi:GTP1/Obg family GTP-binding protein